MISIFIIVFICIVVKEGKIFFNLNIDNCDCKKKKQLYVLKSFKENEQTLFSHILLLIYLIFFNHYIIFNIVFYFNTCLWDNCYLQPTVLSCHWCVGSRVKLSTIKLLELSWLYTKLMEMHVGHFQVLLHRLI